MSLVKWKPFGTTVGSVEDSFGSLWADPFKLLSDDAFFSGDWKPAVDIREADDHFVIHAELPGLTKDDVQVTFENQVLTISGERRAEAEEEKKGYFRSERCYGSFARSFRLPDADPDHIQAKMKGGVLEVTIGKKPTAVKKTIDVAAE